MPNGGDFVREISYLSRGEKTIVEVCGDIEGLGPFIMFMSNFSSVQRHSCQK